MKQFAIQLHLLGLCYFLKRHYHHYKVNFTVHLCNHL